jgi:radical SAM protein with 4Fe4S-binding SPASM domain
MERKLIEVAWEITDQCNLNCLHCYNPRKREDLPYEKTLNVLHQLKEIGVEKVKYGGGEPLVRHDFLGILEKTISLGFDTTFSTNGLIVNPCLAERIKYLGLTRVQVSLDGNLEVHNKIRNNPEIYQKATEAISIFTSKKFNVSVATTLIKPNLNCLEEIFEECLSRRVNRWRVMKYIPSDGQELTPSPSEYLRAHQQLLELKNRTNEMEVFVAREFNEICEKQDRYDSSCFGGRSTVSIRANGDVSPCSYFPSLVVGNVKEKTFEELWNSEKMKKFANEVYGNEDCPHYKLCQGGCKAANFYIEKNKRCDPYCWIKQK